MIAALAACGAAVFSFFQTKMMYKASKHDAYVQKNLQSASLALFYATQIIPRCSYMHMALAHSDAYASLKSDLSKSYYRKGPVKFDSDEFKCITGKTPFDFTKALWKELETDDSNVFHDTMRAHIYLQISYPSIGSQINPTIPDQDEETDKVACDKTNVFLLKEEFSTIAVELLNDLEYFSMSINTGVADSDTLYPSIHQTFFDIARELYWCICNTNKTTEKAADRYYTHVIDLYNSWQEECDSCSKRLDNEKTTSNEIYKINRDAAL